MKDVLRNEEIHDNFSGESVYPGSTECSVYCQPDKKIHVVVCFASEGINAVTEGAGILTRFSKNYYCLKPFVWYEQLHVEPAFEVKVPEAAASRGKTVPWLVTFLEQ